MLCWSLASVPPARWSGLMKIQMWPLLVIGLGLCVLALVCICVEDWKHAALFFVAAQIPSWIHSLLYSVFPTPAQTSEQVVDPAIDQQTKEHT